MDYKREERRIILNRELSNLDDFALNFTRIVKKHARYVIISGYVSILLGRTRTTEDIDMFIMPISKERFNELYEDLIENGFWCLNSDNPEIAFNYLKSGLAIRFSIENMPIPNFEVKFPKDSLGLETFNDSIEVILPKGDLIISCLERHIAFKRYFLKSKKDLEDAGHIEEFFKEKLDYQKINKIKNLIEKNAN